MAVNDLVKVAGRLQLAKDFLVPADDAREVHHLAEAVEEAAI